MIKKYTIDSDKNPLTKDLMFKVSKFNTVRINEETKEEKPISQ